MKFQILTRFVYKNLERIGLKKFFLDKKTKDKLGCDANEKKN